MLSFPKYTSDSEPTFATPAVGREVELRKSRAWQVSLPQPLAQPE